MSENSKFWKKPEELIKADTKMTPATNDDPFKVKCVSLPGDKEVTGKAFTKNYVKGNRPTKPRMGQDHLRWTEVELKYSKVKGRIFDKLVRDAAAKPDPFEFRPMYSSFAPNRVFVPPTSSADTLSKQLAAQRERETRSSQDPPPIPTNGGAHKKSILKAADAADQPYGQVPNVNFVHKKGSVSDRRDS